MPAQALALFLMRFEVLGGVSPPPPQLTLQLLCVFFVFCTNCLYVLCSCGVICQQPLRAMVVFLFYFLLFGVWGTMLRSIYKISFLKPDFPVTVLATLCALIYVFYKNNPLTEECFNNTLKICAVLSFISMFWNGVLAVVPDEWRGFVIDRLVMTAISLSAALTAFVTCLISFVFIFVGFLLMFVVQHFQAVINGIPGVPRRRIPVFRDMFVNVLNHRIQVGGLNVVQRRVDNLATFECQSNRRVVKRLDSGSKTRPDKNYKNKKQSIVGGEVKSSEIIDQGIANLQNRPKVKLESGSSVAETGPVVGHTSLFSDLSKVSFDDNAYLGKQKSKNKRSSNLTPEALLSAVKENMELVKLSCEFHMYNSSGTLNYSFDTKVSETPIGTLLPDWASGLTFIGLAQFMSSFHQHPLSNQENHPYTKLRFKLVDYSMRHWMFSDLDMIGTLAVFLSLIPNGMPGIAQESIDNYPLPPSYVYESNRFFNCDSATMGSGDDVEYGSPNLLMELFDHKQIKATRSVVTGIVKSLAIKHDNKIQPIIAELRSIFVPIPSIFDFDGKKKAQKRLIYKVKSKGVWFTNLLPRKAFYFHHKGGDQATYEVVGRLIKQLISGIEDFARNYVEVGTMTPQEKSILLKTRKNRFVTYMRAPQAQMMFHSGMKKKLIIQQIYHDEVRRLTDNRCDAVDAARERKSMKRSKGIAADRGYKYSFLNDYTNSDYVEENIIVESKKITKYPKFETQSDTAMLVAAGGLLAGAAIGYASIRVSRRLSSTVNNVDEAISSLRTVANRIDGSIQGASQVLSNVVGQLPEGNQSTVATVVANTSAATDHLLSIAQRVDAAIGAFQTSSMFSVNRQTNPENLILLMEFKTILHLVYAWQYGTRADLISWGSNLAITRSDQIFNLLTVMATAMPLRTAAGEQLILESFTELLSQVVGVLHKQGINNIDEDDLRRANTQFNYIRNVQQAVKTNADMAVSVIRVISTMLFGYDPFDPSLNQYTSLAMQAIVDSRRWRLSPPASKEQHIEFLKEYGKYATMNTDERIAKIPSFMKSAFLAAHRSMEEQASVSTPFVTGDRRRAEPVFILFVGKPGSGKSACMARIKRNIYATETNGVEDDYVYNPDSEYFEGYACNTTVTMDDAFIISDPMIRAMHVANIIRMVNNSPNQLNMAFGGAQGKGNVYFVSKYILMSTNALGPDMQFSAGVADMDAFYRRVHIEVLRDEKHTGDTAYNDTFIITRCPMFPNVIGKRLNSNQITVLMKKCRQELERRFQVSEAQQQVDLSTVIVPGLDEEVGPIAQHVENAVEAAAAAITDVVPYEPQGNDKLVKVYTPPEALNSAEYVRLFFQAFEAPQWWKENWIPATVVIFMTLAGGIAAARILWPDFFSAEDRMLTESADHRRRKKDANRRIKVRRQAIQPSRFKVESNNSREPDGFARLRKCAVQFVCTYSDSEHQYVSDCTAIHMGDDYYLYPAHFHYDFDKYQVDSFAVVGNDRTTLVDYNLESIVFFEGMDMQMIKLDTSSCRPPSAKQFLVRNAEDPVISELYAGQFVSVISRRSEGSTVIKGVLSPTGTGVTYSANGEKFRVDCPLRYECKTQKGDSGGIIAFADSRGKHWILGMHVGKLTLTPTKEIGVAVPWSLEMLSEALSGYVSTVSTSQETAEATEVTTESSTTTFPFVVDSTVLQGQRLPYKTAIRKSPLYGYDGPSVYKPAYLKPFEAPSGEVLDPRLLAISAQAQDKIEIKDYPELDGVSYLFAKYSKCPRYSFILNWDQVINGVPEIAYPGLDGTTSAGYPYNLVAGVKGKMPYITLQDGKHVYQDGFFSEIQNYDTMFLDGRGSDVQVVWADMLKDELRPVEKANLGKTRLISTSPLHFTLLMRRYFGSFVAYVHGFAAHKFVSVGINVHSKDWEVLFNRFYRPKFVENPHQPFTPDYDEYLSSHSSIISGDFSKWDKRAPIDVARVFIDYVNDWYGDEFAQVRLALWDKMSHQLRLFTNIMYYIHNGNPSGNAITAEYNSFIQMLCWLPILHQDLGLNSDEFDLALYGDDCLVVLNKPGITTSSLSNFWMDRYQLEFTHSSKTAVEVVETIFTVNYIGRKFVPYKNPSFPALAPVILAPLDIVVIKEIMYYVKGNESVQDSNMVQSFSSVLIELSHYPPEIYKLEAEKILDAAQEHLSSALYSTMLEVYNDKLYNDYYRSKYIRDGLPAYSLISRLRDE